MKAFVHKKTSIIACFCYKYLSGLTHKRYTITDLSFVVGTMSWISGEPGQGFRTLQFEKSAHYRCTAILHLRNIKVKVIKVRYDLLIFYLLIY